MTVATVARLLGIAPATLRTWDRRYGLGPSVHVPGAHRRYEPADLDRLRAMRRLMLAGVSPGEAAQHVRDHGTGAGPPQDGAPPTTPGGCTSARADGPATGCQQEAVRGLTRAAIALDAHAVVQTLRASLATEGVVPTWEHVLRPVLVALGERWAQTGLGVDAEHLISDGASLALREWGMRHVPPLDGAPALLACTPDDRHSLPLFALAAALSERQVGARVLGATVPATALSDAVRRLGPGVVFVWSQLTATADVSAVGQLPRLRPAPVVLLGGAGWAGEVPPTGVSITDSLEDAVARIAGLLAPF